MLRDAHGNTISTTHPETIAAVDIYTADWIGYGQRLRTIFGAADADPDCAFVNACAASVHMALEARSGFEAAQPYLARMRATAAQAGEREQAFISAVDAWSHSNTREALELHRDLVERWPSDIAAAKWGQYHAFNMGHTVAMRSIAEAILPVHREIPEAWGMLAFAEEQCHRTEMALEAAFHGLSLCPTDPWAHHAIAHAYESQDRTKDAIKFLTARAPGWESRSIFIREHNWWHLAQFHLDQGEYVRVLEIYDDHLWGTWPEFAQEQVGAVSALWRLELMGVDVGARWQAVAGKIAERGHEHVLPFHDLHFLYALARSGDSELVESFLHSLAQHAIASRDSVWPRVAYPVARALVAHARGRYDHASLLLLPLLGQLHHLGGSHSQRDVLLQTWIHSSLRAHEYSSVDDALRRYVRHRADLGSMRRFVRHARRHCDTPPRLRVA
jgi:tetratricopeptide (TPR) repeat protein